MLEIRNLFSECAAIGPNSLLLRREFVPSVAELAAPFVNGVLKIKRKVYFGAFDHDVRANQFQEVSCLNAAYVPNVLWSGIWVSLAVIVAVTRSAKSLMKCINDRLVAHPNASVELHAGMPIILAKGGDADVTLAIKETCSVSSVHRALDEKLANSGNTQTGQSRAKQEPKAPGVCNEHVPTAKAKMCSELRRNTEKSAEMSGSVHVYAYSSLHGQVTDCNTKYIHWRPHRDRNFVPIGGDRMSTNQDAVVKLIGFAGNLTASGLQFQGIAFE